MACIQHACGMQHEMHAACSMECIQHASSMQCSMNQHEYGMVIANFTCLLHVQNSMKPVLLFTYSM